MTSSETSEPKTDSGRFLTKVDGRRERVKNELGGKAVTKEDGVQEIAVLRMGRSALETNIKAPPKEELLLERIQENPVLQLGVEVQDALRVRGCSL
jgi:hypothetical protein